MEEEVFARKITAKLDEIELSSHVESRLALARQKAMLKYDETHTVETQADILIAKASFNNPMMRWFALGLGMAIILFIGNTYNMYNNRYVSNEPQLSVSTKDYEDFLKSSYREEEDFKNWDNNFSHELK